MRWAGHARLLLCLAALTAPAVRAADTPAAEASRYRLHGERPWRYVSTTNRAGYRLVLGSSDGRNLNAQVEVDAAALPDEASFPPSPETLPEEARALLAVPPDAEADALSTRLLRGSRTVLEAIERVVAFTSRRIHYELPHEGREETAAACLRALRGSCVGRSLLAADLLARGGVPVRQVTGVLVAGSADELAPDSRPVFNEDLGGVRHRWIEAFVPGLGWVPSDPGGLANTVTSRHLALASPPEGDFGVTVLGRSAELRWPRLVTHGSGVTLGRPRGASLVVRNAHARPGGAVVLSLLSGSAAPIVMRADSPMVRFDRVPPGDYRVVWKSPDGRVEAADVSLSGPADVDLSARSRETDSGGFPHPSARTRETDSGGFPHPSARARETDSGGFPHPSARTRETDSGGFPHPSGSRP